jgi:hypothetical protein
MSEYVLLSKQGFVARKRRRFREADINPTGTILTFIHRRCEIAPGTTLLDLFNAVDQDELLMLFLEDFSQNGWIKEFHQEARLPLVKTETLEEYMQRSRERARKLDCGEKIEPEFSISYDPADYPDYQSDEESDEEKPIALEVSIMIEREHKTKRDLKKSLTKHDLKKSMTDYVFFSGIGENGRVSILTSSMRQLAHLPIRLGRCEYFFDKRRTTIPHVFTLLELLHGIYWNISFHGGPTETEKFWKKLQDEAIETGILEP